MKTMKELLRKLTSISTLAGVVLAVLAFCPHGSIAANAILICFVTFWAVCKLLLRYKGNGCSSTKSMIEAKKCQVYTENGRKPASSHSTYVRRSDGSDFEIPDVGGEEEPEEDDTNRLLLDSVNSHVTDLLRNCYPGADWKWLCADPISQIVSGGVARIRLLSVAEYTYADISFADPKKLDIQMIRTEPLPRVVMTPNSSAPVEPETSAVQHTPDAPKPQETDVKIWYSLIGQRALEQIITDLNVRGCRRLTIDASGAVYAAEEGKEPHKELTLDRMPAMSYWDELKRLLSEQELTATVEQNHLVIGW